MTGANVAGQQCQRCKGVGHSRAFVFVTRESGCTSGWEDVPCDQCEGTGVLTDQRIDLLNLGAQITKARHARDESNGECSRRIGVSRATLSDAEHARLPLARAEEIYRLVDDA